MKKTYVYIVKTGTGCYNKINMVTTDINKAKNRRDALNYVSEMGGAKGIAWIEKFLVED